jgi:hypothetical protein
MPLPNPPMKITELFEAILERPVLYVSNCNISSIYHFIGGYSMCLYKKNELDKDDEQFYFNFMYWLDERFRINMKTLSWEKIILFNSGSEMGAYQNTKKLWYKYKEAVHDGWKPEKIC